MLYVSTTPLQTMLKRTYIHDPLSGRGDLAAAWNLRW